MARIFVNLSTLWNSAKAMGQSGVSIRQGGVQLSNSGSRTPSYDGQFNNWIQAITAQATGRAKLLGGGIEELGFKVGRKADLFRAVDNEGYSGLTFISERLQFWLRDNLSFLRVSGLASLNRISQYWLKLIPGLPIAFGFFILSKPLFQGARPQLVNLSSWGMWRSPNQVLFKGSLLLGGGFGIAKILLTEGWGGIIFNKTIATEKFLMCYAPQPAPRNMKMLANQIMDLGVESPVKFYVTASGEYVVLMRGTVWGYNSINGASAVITGVNLEGSYVRQVKAFIANLPAGAVVHFAGHSQGGMVGNSLAVDPEVTSHVEVKSVTTFGSPRNSPENPETHYNRYQADGDWVSDLSTDFGDSQTVIPYEGDRSKHDSYRDSSHLEQIGWASESDFEYAHPSDDWPYGSTEEWSPVVLTGPEVPPDSIL